MSKSNKLEFCWNTYLKKTICNDCQEKCENGSIPFYRPTWLEIDVGAVRSNVKKIKKYISQGNKDVHLMAVVKCNADGHGLIQIAEVAISSGATWLGVATLDEAIVLRIKLSKQVPILVFGYVSTEHLPLVSQLKITVTAISLEWIKEAAVVAKEPFDFHLKLDTGLNRYGCVTEDEVESFIKYVWRFPNLKLEGVYTHFATAENVNDKTYFLKQLKRFDELLKLIPKREKKIIHCANSCATLYYDEKPFYNMVRCGRALMGPPNENLKNHQAIKLQTSISLRSTLSHVKQLAAGESISYGREYTTEQNQWIGTVPIGYADGWYQQYRSCNLLIDGKRVPIAGVICMDQLMVTLPQYYPVGTRVTLIGKCGEDRIVADDIDAIAKQPRSQIYSNFTIRVPRIYIENGEIISVSNVLLSQKLLNC